MTAVLIVLSAGGKAFAQTGNEEDLQVLEQYNFDIERNDIHPGEKLSPERKQRIARAYQYFRRMGPEERRKIVRHWRRFQALPLARRQQIRERYVRWQDMSAEQKADLRKRFRLWRDMSVEKRRKIRRRHLQKSDYQRRYIRRVPAAEEDFRGIQDRRSSDGERLIIGNRERR
ncbi:MAG: DUF3106 domain-containing protein [Candidatus Omnitrophota bacterium]